MATPTFTPSFTRVQQCNDFDCAFACVATLAGKSLEDVRQVAIERFQHPRRGPYWITEDLIISLLAHYSWVGSVYKPASGIASLPDLCIGMVEYNEETEIGRHVVFHRQPAAAGKSPTEYIIDPAYWAEANQQVRTDIKGLPISWFIAVHPMNKSPKAEK